MTSIADLVEALTGPGSSYDSFNRQLKALVGGGRRRQRRRPGTWRTAGWINKRTKKHLYPDLLKKARCDGRIPPDAAHKFGARWQYELNAIGDVFTDYRAVLLGK